MLRLENVSKTFISEGKQIHAAQNVSLTVADGEIFGIIGYSGAGKSTLVRLINQLERPDEGKVYIDDVELTSLPEKELRVVRRSIGMIFQNFNLMRSRTAYDNVAFALMDSGMSKQDIDARVTELLDYVGLSDKRDAYPSQLSGGQKQRVAIARALANNPKILLCDEATSALDPQTTLSILSLLKDLNVTLGLTIVIITHEMSVVKEICHQVAVMEDGHLIETGDLFSIFARPQTEITRRFISTTSNLQKVYSLIAANSPVVALKPGEMIVKLRFIERNASEPLVSTISRRLNLNFNIIFGDIEIIQDAPIGGLIVIVGGEPEILEQAFDYFKANKVEVEVIKRA